MAVISFIVVFSVLVFIHELGHYLAAKLNGIIVYEFAVGMGPKLFSKQYGETIYSLRALPIGGYVRMNEDELESEDPRSFVNKKPWRRFTVIIAGPLMNFILAVVLLTGAHSFTGVPTNVIGDVVENMPAAIAGFEAGDKIVEIEGVKTKSWEAVIREVGKYKDQKINITVVRDGAELDFAMAPVYDASQNKTMIGITTSVTKNIFVVTSYSVRLIGNVIQNMVNYIGTLFVGKADLNQVAGIVGIAQMVGEATRNGILDIMFLAALLSINLGIINLVPFPALDGGRLVFIIFEMIFRRPVPKNLEAYVHLAGFVVLMGLMIMLFTRETTSLIFK